MPVHEFGIIEDIVNEKNEIGYEPLRYKCISVDDDIINSLSEHLSIMKTYYHSLKRPDFGFAYWGITIIPPESLSLFYEAVISSTFYEGSAALNELATKINEANEDNKHMIHYGV
ncbi:short-chain dehydrogenase [Peribacillus deserti]|uniref:Short-chain dehydrogenase n=1 Tax=Peribacillus deserti TaxID=673318 RepID=A0A2N5M4L1_9BACI|nr:short-chain dehydrogenase [Peribacillus deserti]PLT29272.1 short-chain dehydrogenase [Peribacillus deserti]